MSSIRMTKREEKRKGIGKGVCIININNLNIYNCNDYMFILFLYSIKYGRLANIKILYGNDNILILYYLNIS